MLAFCDNTNEALTGMLRSRNAGSNTAADHIAVIDAALAQIPPSTGTAIRCCCVSTAPARARRC